LKNKKANHTVGTISDDPMKVLNVTTWDAEGEQFNGYQIHRYLKEKRHESYMAVLYKKMDDPDIHRVGNTLIRLYDRTFVTVLEKITGLRSIFPISGITLLGKSFFRNADVVHLQIVHGVSFFSLLLIPYISHHRRTVWTIHDPWLMSGHCIYSMECTRWKDGCGRCPDLKLPFPVLWDSTALAWKIKRWVMSRADVTLVVASRWMQERVQQSPILSHLPCRIIPLGLNLEKYRSKDKRDCRKRFNIPEDVHVLAFRYTGEDDRLKGWPYLREALNVLKLTKATYIIILQKKGAARFLDKRFTCIELGWIDDQEILIDALNAADIFLMPSIAEAFGMMAVESMACGTPVIVFEGTSLPSVIHAPEGGVAVKYKDANALAHSIEELLEDKERYDTIVQTGLEIVRDEYNADKYLKSHIDLYYEIINSPEQVRKKI